MTINREVGVPIHPVHTADVAQPPVSDDEAARGKIRPLVYAAGGYTLLSFFVWVHIWTNHPRTTTVCNCGDGSLFTWFLEWPAYAIDHGLNPFYSSFLNHPQGVNLLSNTSVTAIGIPLAPITWLFGPIATLNVALTLSPVLSALAMFVLLRRWVRWMPAAFFGGLLYGFSPFALVSLSNAWLMVGMAPIPPLIVLCLDELLFRQRKDPFRVGIGLGLLVVVQFFLGTELLLIVGITIAIGLLAIVLYAGWLRNGSFERRLGFAARGLVTGGITAGVLLAYPTWFALEGPASLRGSIWGSISLPQMTDNLENFVIPKANNVSAVTGLHLFGGYLGPFLSHQYLGIGLVAVLVIGLIVWRHDRKLWLCGVVAVSTLILSLGAPSSEPLPWRLVAHAPVLENIWPARFLVGTYLASAVMLGLIIDHAHASLRDRPLRSAAPKSSYRHSASGRHILASTTAIGVALVALTPIVLYEAQGLLPMTTQQLSLPSYIRHLPPTIGSRDVLLIYPPISSGIQTSETWQAVDRMAFSMVGVGGPAEFQNLELGPAGHGGLGGLRQSSSLPNTDHTRRHRVGAQIARHLGSDDRGNAEQSTLTGLRAHDLHDAGRSADDRSNGSCSVL